MGRNGKNSPNAAKIASGPVTERLTLLEKRYSKVMVHQAYFGILEEWMRCMFGAQIFPKTSEISKIDDEKPDEENPFYELYMLRRKVAALEERLSDIEYAVVPGGKSNGRFKAPPPPVTIKRPYQPTVRRKAGYHAKLAIEIQATTAVPNPLHKPKNDTTATITNKDVEDDSVATLDITTSSGTEKANQGENSDVTADGENKTGDNEGDSKPPILKQEMVTESDTSSVSGELKMEPGSIIDSAEPSPHSLINQSQLEDMDIDDSNEDEDYDDDSLDQKPTIIQEGVAIDGSPVAGRRVSGRGVKRFANSSIAAIEKDDDEPVVTYTTRGRRHTLPRRYAEFTGHDNVASILKSQQRAAAASQSSKLKKGVQEKTKTPTKIKPAPAPKLPTPKKPLADGTRPEIVYDLITKVQSRDVDETGNVVLWDEYPQVKVNQQQLISVIYRSNGMSTRLTRKLTTLVFEDQVLANASPFGTKYYSERLPPEPLLAMVEFISASGFDPDYTKKKIYMIVGQVCNEARAGRVRKLVPSADIKLEEEQGEVEPSTSSSSQ